MGKHVLDDTAVGAESEVVTSLLLPVASHGPWFKSSKPCLQDLGGQSIIQEREFVLVIPPRSCVWFNFPLLIS